MRSLDARRGNARKVGNFLLLCSVQVSCNSVQQEIIQQWKKNYWALFWYMNKRVPSCTEAAVVNRHICVLQLACHLVCYEVLCYGPVGLSSNEPVQYFEAFNSVYTVYVYHEVRPLGTFMSCQSVSLG